MLGEITHVTVLVADTDEALEWYTRVFGFEVHADEEFAPGARWVTVAPPGGGTEAVLQEPNPELHGDAAAEMRQRIGEATMTVIGTDDCRGTIDELADRGVTVTTEPEPVPWGVHAIVEDLYGNPYNVVESA